MSKTLTFKKFMGSELSGKWSLYVVRDFEKVLYVGITERHIVDRWFGALGGHLRQNYYGEFIPDSPIGERIVRNMPASLDWTIQLFTKDELIEKFRKELERRHSNIEKGIDLTELEDYMIIKLCPEMNHMRPTPSQRDMEDMRSGKRTIWTGTKEYELYHK